MIPMKIHQSWKTKQVPEHWRDYQLSWIANHPHYEYKLWTDEENRAFLEKNYPWFLDTYDSYPENITKADSMRPFYLYHFGGIYADLDYESYQNLDNFLEYQHQLGNNVVLATQMVGDRASNYLMMSEAGHPFWLKVIEHMQENSERKWYQTRMMYLWKSAGPNAINTIYQSQDWNDVELLDNANFNPFTPSNDTIMYGKHHESQSWGDSNSDRILSVIDTARKVVNHSSSSES
mgnify:CR=1 FL=1